MNRSCIITTPCAGKTTFRKSYKSNYKGLRIVEQALEELPVCSCNLVWNHPPEQDKYIYAIVLPTKEQLILQSDKRKIECPDSEWVGETLFTHPEKGYYAVQQTAEEYNIPVFETFEKALDFIITKMS